MQIAIRKIGNSQGIVLPKKLLDELRLQSGDNLNIEIEGDHLVMQPVHTKPKYKLDNMIAACDLDAPIDIEIAEWGSASSVGDEIL